MYKDKVPFWLKNAKKKKKRDSRNCLQVFPGHLQWLKMSFLHNVKEKQATVSGISISWVIAVCDSGKYHRDDLVLFAILKLYKKKKKKKREFLTGKAKKYQNITPYLVKSFINLEAKYRIPTVPSRNKQAKLLPI